jgi:AcrR family transcriptional regulator
MNRRSSSIETERATPRGTVTRDAILQAAMQVFGEDGFHAASTRTIAQTAGANQALISYHFGSKERLYLAVFEDIATRIEGFVGPILESVLAEADMPVRGPLRGSKAKAVERNIALVQRVVRGFVAMLTRDETTQWARLILREQQSPSKAFDILYERIFGRVISLLTKLISRIAGRTKITIDDRLTAMTIMGQALVFRAARAAVLRHLEWSVVGDAEIEAIQERVAANVAAVLRATADRGQKR